MNFEFTKNKIIISIGIPLLIWLIDFFTFTSSKCYDCPAEIVTARFHDNLFSFSIGCFALVLVVYVVYSLIQKK